MGGYAVTARIARAPVRAAGGLAPPAGATAPRIVTENRAPAMVAVEEADARGRLEEWLGDLRTRWEQTTFYLFDAEGWR
jgi:hypothetical protein